MPPSKENNMGKFYRGSCKLEAIGNGYKVLTPFNRDFLDHFKSALSSKERTWVPGNDDEYGYWMIVPSAVDTVAKLIKDYYDEDINVPKLNVNASQKEGVFNVQYLGTTKPKNDDCAFGQMLETKQWNILIPRDVLLSWFEGQPVSSKPSQSFNDLFSLLGVQRTATDDEIRSGFRRIARQWHPDVCKEPNAEDVFKKINEAYQTLSDPAKRKRYVFGLNQQKALSETPRESMYIGTEYRAPLRCGKIKVKYHDELTRHVVDEILAWDEIVVNGMVLVSSWPSGSDEPLLNWVPQEWI